MAHVLFVCRQNAGRSQMSRALFERMNSGRHAALSAGTEPAKRIHPDVVTVLREVNLDVSRRTPRLLTDDMARWADVIVTMGCGDACPVIPGKRYIDWELPDPQDLSLDEVRELRDEIASRVRELVKDLDRAAIRG